MDLDDAVEPVQPVQAPPVVEVPSPAPQPVVTPPIEKPVEQSIEQPAEPVSKKEEKKKSKNKKESKHPKLKRFFKRILVMIIKIALVCGILLLLFTYVFGFHQQNGLSMYPKFVDSDLLLYYRLETKFHTGDVVVAKVGNKEYALRIVAIANDVVDMDDEGNLYVNDHEVNEDIFYITKKKKNVTYPYIVGENEVFLLGDYRTHSKDSRNFGAVNIKDIKGKVINLLRTRDI